MREGKVMLLTRVGDGTRLEEDDRIATIIRMITLITQQLLLLFLLSYFLLSFFSFLFSLSISFIESCYTSTTLLGYYLATNLLLVPSSPSVFGGSFFLQVQRWRMAIVPQRTRPTKLVLGN